MITIKTSLSYVHRSTKCLYNTGAHVQFHSFLQPAIPGKFKNYQSKRESIRITTIMFQSTQPAIAPGAIILVTGVSGFVGSHVADQLLDAGYKVRGTTRDATKNSWIAALFDKKYGKGKFELQTVSDLGQPGAFESVLEGTVWTCHSPYSDSEPKTDIGMYCRSRWSNSHSV